jgi:hypothetical protein
MRKAEKATPKPDWHWGTPEGSREFDRLVDRSMTFRECLEWLEEAETLALRLANQRSRRVSEAGEES